MDILTKNSNAPCDVFVKLQSSIRVRENLSKIAKQQGAMYQALEDRRPNDSRPSTEGRLEVLSATQYNRDVFNNANSLQVAGNQVNNVGSHNSTQMTTKIIQSITSGAVIHVSVLSYYPYFQVGLEAPVVLDSMGELAGQVEISR